MSYGAFAWKLRSGSSLTASVIYGLVGEVDLPDLDDLDLVAIESALDQRFPGWREPDSPFICIFHSKYLLFEMFHSQAETTVPQLMALCRSLGLTFFDPQVEDVPEKAARLARQLLGSIREGELREIREAEIADLSGRAAAGDAKAMLDLANRLAFGDGVKQNADEAFRLYLQAAEAGSADAMFNVAASFQHGDGVRQDVHEAIRWYLRAAEHDKAYAPFALGEIYLGFGPVARDNAKAEAYFREALVHGHPDASAALRLIKESKITLELKKKVFKFWNPRA